MAWYDPAYVRRNYEQLIDWRTSWEKDLARSEDMRRHNLRRYFRTGNLSFLKTAASMTRRMETQRQGARDRQRDIDNLVARHPWLVE